MASNYVCRACLRALRSQTSSLRPLEAPLALRRPRPFLPSSRSLQTSNRRLVSSAPQETPPSHPQNAQPTMSTASASQRITGGKTEDLGPVPTAAQLNAALRNRKSTSYETYAAYGATERLLNECVSQASYRIPESSDPKRALPRTEDGQDVGVGAGWWYEAPGLGLKPTFSTWAQISFLHMWIVLVRLRLLPEGATGVWQQHFTDHFFTLAETNMESLHRIDNGTVRKRYLKDLFVQWRGAIAAYDEGLVKGDSVLAAAVWRNVFKGAEDVDPVGLACVVSYVRREVARVSRLPEHVVQSGAVGFGSPGEERSVVLMETKGMKEPFMDAR